MKERIFELVQIKELPSNINRGINIDSEIIGKSQIAFLIVLQYQDGKDIVGLHVQIRFMTPQNQVLLEEGATLVALLDGWREMTHDDESLRNNPSVVEFVGYGLSFVSGMIFRHTSGTILNSVFAPYINPKGIMQDVVIQKKIQ